MELIRQAQPLWTPASRVGDLIFLSGKGLLSDFVRIWQQLSRQATPDERQFGVSHVAIVIGGGVLMHATTAKTKRQLLTEILPTSGPTGGIRILRRSLALTDDDEGRLVQAIQRHDRQSYTVGIGPIGSLWRDFVRRGTALTLPNCSELATLGYSAIGIDLGGRRPAGEVLPIDLLRATRDGQWTDVTELYYPPPMPLAFPDGTPIKWPAEPDHGVFARTEHMIGEGLYEQFHAAIAIINYQEELASLFEPSTSLIKVDPDFVVVNSPDAAVAIVSQVMKVYDWVASYPQSATASPIIDGIIKSFSHVEVWDAPYEGQPTFAELQVRERTLNASDFIRMALRVESLFIALRDACQRSDKLSLAYQTTLLAVPLLPKDRLDAARIGLERLATTSPELADCLESTFACHEALIAYRTDFTASHSSDLI